MTTFDDRSDDVDPAFPDVVDDAAPERSGYPEPQVAALPGDDYLAVDEFGTTVQEQLDGEPLDAKLDREVPDPTADPDAFARAESDEELDYENRMLSDPEGMSVGRLIEPDEGAHTDLETDAIAREAGGGGEADLSAEESAMHVVPEV